MKRIRYILEYIIAYPFYILMSKLSIDTASNIGSFLARHIGPLTPAMKIARKNINFVFPNLSEHEKEKIIMQMWDNLGRTITEMPHIHTMSDQEFASRVQIITNENFTKLSNKKATICISGHFGNWETGARTIVPYNDKISIIYRDANNQLMNESYLAMRNNRFTNIAKGHKGVKKIIEAVKNKHFVCFLADQKLNQGISVNLFNRPSMTAKAPISLAVKFKLPMLFVHSIRTKGANFKVYIDGPYEAYDLVKNIDDIKLVEDKELALTQKMNDIIEGWIRRDPSQWFWVHRRWEKEFYNLDK